jgi:hypothetical protein
MTTLRFINDNTCPYELEIKSNSDADINAVIFNGQALMNNPIVLMHAEYDVLNRHYIVTEIDSFFDVFTELAIDNGLSPNNDKVHQFTNALMEKINVLYNKYKKDHPDSPPSPPSQLTIVITIKIRDITITITIKI